MWYRDAQSNNQGKLGKGAGAWTLVVPGGTGMLWCHTEGLMKALRSPSETRLVTSLAPCMPYPSSTGPCSRAASGHRKDTVTSVPAVIELIAASCVWERPCCCAGRMGRAASQARPYSIPSAPFQHVTTFYNAGACCPLDGSRWLPTLGPTLPPIGAFRRAVVWPCPAPKTHHAHT